MKVIGLTGGVGTGKSTCAAFLRARSLPVVDTDDLARQFVEPGQEALAEVAATFGSAILDSQGRLKRRELARRVFNDAEARRRLEAILHPRIREAWWSRMSIWQREGRPVGVVVIPLLFETGAEAEVDVVLCVACSAATQLKRLVARGWSAEETTRRIAAQLPLETKMARADFVIWNEAGLDVHQRQLELILGSIRA